MNNIDFAEFNMKSLLADGHVGVMFQKNPLVRQYRDTITFYRDGRIHFIRFCYGESAGPVADVWSRGTMGEQGGISWDTSKCIYSKILEATPSTLYATDEDGALYFDDEPYSWSRTKDYKTAPEYGYNWFKCLFIK